MVQELEVEEDSDEQENIEEESDGEMDKDFVEIIQDIESIDEQEIIYEDSDDENSEQWEKSQEKYKDTQFLLAAENAMKDNKQERARMQEENERFTTGENANQDYFWSN
ncbi:14327_t:CDS:2 [Ambispora leptoticha]|uniref:14327_t:CDS:1 n=1 Tax=Ambispora leptoticha TaxID=144679 RepID=A0A9N9CAZ5_9GLOM|nr:14327_t:CDS:2 [Ambispora leptoticha]